MGLINETLQINVAARTLYCGRLREVCKALYPVWDG